MTMPTQDELMVIANELAKQVGVRQKPPPKSEPFHGPAIYDFKAIGKAAREMSRSFDWYPKSNTTVF